MGKPMDGESRNGRFVGLVLVSHSAAIADGLAQLVGQVAGPSVPIVAAGGGPDGTFGTDGGRVLAAPQEASPSARAVCLMDLGSSVLSVRAPPRVLPPEAPRVLPAPAA